MARLPRFVVAGQAHHVVLRSLPGSPAFVGEADHGLFLEALHRSGAEQGVTVHAYALLPDAVQLLVTPAQAESLSQTMQALARFYVPAFNRRYGRSGALWSGRYRAAPVGGAQALLTCMLYIEQAPERAGLGASLGYAWSSALHHAGRGPAGVLSPVPAQSGYWALGNTPFARDAAYAVLLESPLGTPDVQDVENSTVKGWALGSGEFLAQLGSKTVRRSAPKPRGRPKVGSAI